MTTAVEAPAAVHRPRLGPSSLRRLAWVLLVAVLAASATAGALYLSGFRWFSVQTPSMGAAAPVGTLVVTAPVRLDRVHVGDVIAFRPPTEPRSVYTHRVAAVDGDELTTRGDINGAADGWRLHQRDLIGSAVLLLPGAGFFMRAVPLLLVGNAVLWLATRGIRSATARAAVRNIGFGAVAALPGFVLHPFVSIQVLATQPAGSSITASIVSTGLLPVRVTAGSGETMPLRDGHVGTMSLPLVTGGYRLRADLDLPAWGWVALIVVCLLPLAWSLLVGLPAAQAPAVDGSDDAGADALDPATASAPAAVP